MIATAVYVLALIAPLAAPTPSKQDPFRGSEESPKLNHTSRGMTLEALNGLPLTRPTWSPPQPQVWVYPSPSLGGYRPPGVGGTGRPRMIWWFP